MALIITDKNNQGFSNKLTPYSLYGLVCQVALVEPEKNRKVLMPILSFLKLKIEQLTHHGWDYKDIKSSLASVAQEYNKQNFPVTCRMLFSFIDYISSYQQPDKQEVPDQYKEWVALEIQRLANK